MNRLGSLEWGTATETLQRVGGGAWLTLGQHQRAAIPQGTWSGGFYAEQRLLALLC